MKTNLLYLLPVAIFLLPLSGCAPETAENAPPSSAAVATGGKTTGAPAGIPESARPQVEEQMKQAQEQAKRAEQEAAARNAAQGTGSK